MRYTAITTLFATLLLSVACSGATDHNIPQTSPEHVDTLWQKEFKTAQELVDNFTAIGEQLAEKDTCGRTANLCQYIWHSGEYMFRCRGKNDDISKLPQLISDINLDNEIVKSFMIERDTARFVDHYFTLKFMQEGSSFEDSRDGRTIPVFYFPRSMNGNDYRKLREVFSSKNEALHIAYMKKLKYPIGNGGCSEELYAIRPIIEQNVKPSRLKKEILDLFDQHKGTMPGEPAPTPPLKDANGKEYTFAQFRGKVIVIDIWATWCSSCLAKMPDFIALSEKYKGNEEIIFLTVSIDRKEVRDSWLTAIEKRKMGNLLNLTPECSEESQFESDYHISGIPRYMVIDKEGNIVTAYAPPAGEGLDEIIMTTINK